MFKVDTKDSRQHCALCGGRMRARVAKFSVGEAGKAKTTYHVHKGTCSQRVATEGLQILSIKK